MQSFKDVWEKALDLLQKELNRISYESWIKLLIPMKIENNVAYFCVNTLFQKSIIDQKYKDVIEESVSLAMGLPVTIKVMTEDEVPPRFRNAAQRINDEVNSNLPRIEEEEIREFNLQPALTFDTFVIGKENEFAHAAAMAIANHPAGAYNPYFLYGNSGLGKTHLINAIANKVREDHPEMTIMYVKGDEFTSELIDAIQFNRQREFKYKYRRADILMVDDVQFISGKKAIQEEFFHTFDAMYDNHRQIIITSDRPPKELATLEERLRGRFSMGLIVDVQPPEYETRVAILRNKCKAYGIQVGEEVIDMIATKIKTNVRELEGTVKKLKAYHNFTGQLPTMALAKKLMEDVIRENSAVNVTPAMVIDHVSRYTNVSVEDLIGDRKKNEYVFARQMAMYIIREMTSLSLPEIGKEFSGKNHTTVLYSIRKMEDIIKQDPATAKIAAELMDNIKKSY